MTAPRFLPASFTFLALGAATLFSGTARAQDCTANGQCPTGFACEEIGAASCPGIACPDGQPCPELPPCEPQVIFGCVPGPCASDADCADGMACVTDTVESCSGEARPACPPDVMCPPPAPPVCTSETVSQCVPRYMLGCNTAADCGEGFDCVPEESCWCSGSSGGGSEPSPGVPPQTDPAAPPPNDAVPPDEKAAPLPPGTGGSSGGIALPPECGCTQGPNNVCQPREIACAATTECPTGWLCTEIDGGTTCSGAAPTPNGEPPPAPECTTIPGRKVCVPPYTDLVYGGVGRDEAGKVVNASGSSGGPTGAPNPQPPGTGNPGTGNNGAAPGESSSSDDGSCQMGTGNAGSSGASLLALIGLAALARRRARAS